MDFGRLFFRAFATALGLASSMTVLAQTYIELQDWGQLQFYYDSNHAPWIKRVYTPQFPEYFEIVPGNPYGTISNSYGVQFADQPPNVTTHAMSFEFYSQDYFSLNPAGHIAVLLKGEWALDHPKTRENENWLLGRGIVIGDVSGAPNGCPSARTAGIEVWRPGGGLIPNTCSSQLSDNTWYKITIHANNNRWIAYNITNLAGTVSFGGAAWQDPTSALPEDLGGWLITPVFNTVLLPQWRLWFNNVRTWWF